MRIVMCEWYLTRGNTPVRIESKFGRYWKGNDGICRTAIGRAIWPHGFEYDLVEKIEAPVAEPKKRVTDPAGTGGTCC